MLLKTNTQSTEDMNFLHIEIGSAKDNQKSPVHNWYKFTAGFSYKFVEEIILLEKLSQKPNSQIFDPFAGCGTTLVSSQKEGVKAVGNEGQAFMLDVIKAKLNWKISKRSFDKYLLLIKDSLLKKSKKLDLNQYAHPLLLTLYKDEILKDLYIVKNTVNSIKAEKYRLFFKLALSQTLHKVSIHPIAVPYISRNKILSNDKSVWEVFSHISEIMFKDIKELKEKESTSKIYLHDSRKPNRYIKNKQCDICITSPPYLNNLDYGEVSKVHTHFFDITNSWNDITNRVRKKLVTGATTHYIESDFIMADFLKSDFALKNKNLIPELVKTADTIKAFAKEKSGKKSFHLLTLLYFKDMYDVLVEIKRVLKRNGTAYLILGDSAPYGVFIPTTEILGRIAKNIGFDSYEIHKIRDRGTKWKSLRFRHSLALTENVLVLK
ncbi:MAG: site-specific DNA-methyltransferase [Sphingobacteriales bacterium JAD_PAG50586_3]|nr:MAG: site-specific DNA-methyltransferase [Sphingobacteriales bacterium JAD_PAG50586_3]